MQASVLQRCVYACACVCASAILLPHSVSHPHISIKWLMLPRAALTYHGIWPPGAHRYLRGADCLPTRAPQDWTEQPSQWQNSRRCKLGASSTCLLRVSLCVRCVRLSSSVQTARLRIPSLQLCFALLLADFSFAHEKVVWYIGRNSSQTYIS